jgi:hypothetical protein
MTNTTDIIDGGIAILDSDLNEIKHLLRWGTFGIDGKQPLQYVRLIDCSTEHLSNILKQRNISEIYQKVIGLILKDRKIDI